jgi:metal-dependent amidase/aminoacylase/carboxypeptidase family protein
MLFEKHLDVIDREAAQLCAVSDALWDNPEMPLGEYEAAELITGVMERYGFTEDFESLLTKWVEAWTTHYDSIKFGQELDPFTGIPSPSSQWYSSCMLLYVYAVRRLGLLATT